MLKLLHLGYFDSRLSCIKFEKFVFKLANHPLFVTFLSFYKHRTRARYEKAIDEVSKWYPNWSCELRNVEMSQRGTFSETFLDRSSVWVYIERFGVMGVSLLLEMRMTFTGTKYKNNKTAVKNNLDSFCIAPEIHDYYVIAALKHEVEKIIWCLH